MFERRTFENLLNEMLADVPGNIDKRPGSVIYDALAPAARKLAAAYADLDVMVSLSYADTASEEFLSRRTAEFGVNRRAAAPARRLGRFFAAGDVPVDVPVGSRYALDGMAFAAMEKVADGEFVLECETPGAAGNQPFGALLPIDYVAGLARGELSDVLVPGTDEESDEALRERYYAAVNEPAFGGNVADYKQKIGAIAGVGAVKVFPVWNGGGTVKATILASDWSEPAEPFLHELQEIVDPVAHAGLGYGTAPIGHTVTIAGVEGVAIDVETYLTLAPGVSVGQVQEDVESIIAAYLLELRKEWAGQSQLVVRVAQIDARLLTVQGVVDVNGTELNGSAANVTLDAEDIPVIGTVTLHA